MHRAHVTARQFCLAIWPNRNVEDKKGPRANFVWQHMWILREKFMSPRQGGHLLCSRGCGVESQALEQKKESEREMAVM